MLHNFLKANQIKAESLINTTVNYLVKTYKQSLKSFSFSTGFGQLILVVSNLFQIVLLYISDAITQLNMHTANRNVTIYGLSRLTGHNPVRGHSAVGEISLRTKEGSAGVMDGNIVYIPNFTRVTCLNNNIAYLMNIGADDIAIDINDTGATKIKIIEGVLDFQRFTGTGEDGQSYEVNAFPGKLIDDQFIIITVNGEKYDIFNSLYEIPFGNKGVLAKTGITSGIDIFFGSDVNLVIPPLGSDVRVDYLLTSGAEGNILDEDVQFKFTDTGFDINGNEVNLDEMFEITTELPPDFGANGESPELTKILAPHISRNFIIHDEQSIKYFLGRMNFFSVIKVFKEILDNENRFNTLLLPIIKNRLGVGEDYFNMDIEKFTLSETEETRLINMIDESGRKSSNITIRLIQPDLRKSAMIIFLEVFERYKGIIVRETQVRKDVREVLNTYHLSNKRVNKIPHSDIVRILDSIDYIDTVKVIFVPENIEDIDTKGNLSVGERSLIVIRGGFTDSESVEYIDEYNPSGEILGSVNLDINFVKNIE